MLRTYHSLTRAHSIIIQPDIRNQSGTIIEMKTSEHSPVDFVLMLKKMAADLTKNNIHTIIQYVLTSEWDDFLSNIPGFEKHGECLAENQTILRCDVNKFPEAVMRAHGFESMY